MSMGIVDDIGIYSKIPTISISNIRNSRNLGNFISEIRKISENIKCDQHRKLEVPFLRPVISIFLISKSNFK